MSKQNKRHPHTYTLQLFRLAIDHLPPGFSAKKAAYFKKYLKRFESDPVTPYEEIRLSITQLGRESWAERQAYQETYDNYGRASEEAFLLQNLDEGLRTKFGKFIEDGGKINYLENKVRSSEELTAPTPFESYFSPEEKFAITQALLIARDLAREEIKTLIKTNRHKEYQQLTREFKHREKIIDEKLRELEKMATLSNKWKETIMDRVRVIEEGWSVMERGVDEQKLEQELEYWRGTLASFLHI